jgi:hypothetical protein
MNPPTAQLLDLCRELIEFVNPNGMAGPPPADWSEGDKRFIEKAQAVVLRAQGDLPETGGNYCCICEELTEHEPDHYGDIYCSVPYYEEDGGKVDCPDCGQLNCQCFYEEFIAPRVERTI